MPESPLISFVPSRPLMVRFRHGFAPAPAKRGHNSIVRRLMVRRSRLDLSLEPGLFGHWSNERCQPKFDRPPPVRPTQSYWL